MKHTLTKYDFIEWMQQAPNNPFSYNGLEILFDYLTSLESDTGEEFEFDPVAFRCDFIESHVEDILSENGVTLDEILTEEEKMETALNLLKEKTIVLDITNKDTILYQNF
jgi:hypothetical protein